MDQQHNDDDNDSRSVSALRSARMLCCATLDEVVAKFDLFLNEFNPPRVRFGDEYLNVLSICVLAPHSESDMATAEHNATAMHATFQAFLDRPGRHNKLLEKGAPATVGRWL